MRLLFHVVSCFQERIHLVKHPFSSGEGTHGNEPVDLGLPHFQTHINGICTRISILFLQRLLMQMGIILSLAHEKHV